MEQRRTRPFRGDLIGGQRFRFDRRSDGAREIRPRRRGGRTPGRRHILRGTLPPAARGQSKEEHPDVEIATAQCRQTSRSFSARPPTWMCGIALYSAAVGNCPWIGRGRALPGASQPDGIFFRSLAGTPVFHSMSSQIFQPVLISQVPAHRAQAIPTWYAQIWLANRRFWIHTR